MSVIVILNPSSLGAFVVLALLGFVSLVFAFLLATNVYGIIRMWWQAKSSAGWPSTTGKVISRNIVVQSGRGHSLHVPVIPYSYVVNGVRYQNDRIAFDQPVNTSYDNAQARALFEAYYPGREVTLFYNPANPAQSVLVRQVRGIGSCVGWSLVLMLLTGFFITTFLIGIRDFLQSTP